MARSKGTPVPRESNTYANRQFGGAAWKRPKASAAAAGASASSSSSSAAAPAAPAAGVKKAHRFHPGTRALMEIRRFQKNSDSLMRKLPIERLVREIAQDYEGMYTGDSGWAFTKNAMAALREAVESLITDLMVETAHVSAGVYKRVTATPEDFQIATERVLPHLKMPHGVGNMDASSSFSPLVAAAAAAAAAAPKKIAAPSRAAAAVVPPKKRSKTEAAASAAVAAVAAKAKAHAKAKVAATAAAAAAASGVRPGLLEQALAPSSK